MEAWDEQCRLMLRRAAEDEEAMVLLSASPKPLVGIIGFHAQQSVEKRLKALLSFRRITFPKTHDIDQLLDCVEASGVTIPPLIQDAASLSPYAVHIRYSELSSAGSDPDEVARLVRTAADVGRWIASLLPSGY